jgi:hypothetical protein
MEQELESLFQFESTDWLSTLPTYQRNRVSQLLDSTQNSYEEAAKQWLSTIPSDTFPFGTEQRQNVFLDKVWDEVEKFLCGDEKYDADRRELLSSSGALETALVSSVSAAIAQVIGVAATYIMPVVVLIFMTIGKIALNAWCQMRKDDKPVDKT